MTDRADAQRWVEAQRQTNFTAALATRKLHMSAPRVTSMDLDACVKDTQYLILPDGRTTLCMLTLDNGFTVHGTSACVSLENFNAQAGRDISNTNARDQLWKLLGFRLADKLMNAVPA